MVLTESDVDGKGEFAADSTELGTELRKSVGQVACNPSNSTKNSSLWLHRTHKEIINESASFTLEKSQILTGTVTSSPYFREDTKEDD